MKTIQANPVEMVKDIYKITNIINGKIYIGQAINTENRFKSHCKPSNKETLIDIAISKYGKENFKVEILESQISNYNEREKYWIKVYNSKVPNGYNVSDGGDSPPRFEGINHPNASIKDEKILNNIVLDLINTTLSYNEIAQKYNTNKKTVLGINHGYRYVNKDFNYPLRKNTNINGKLTEDDVDSIIEELYYSYDTNTNIGKKYGISEHAVRDINNGKYHHRDNIEYPIRNINAARCKLTYEEIMEIANLLKNSQESKRSIAKKYGINESTVQNINVGASLYKRRELTYPLRLPPHKK